MLEAGRRWRSKRERLQSFERRYRPALIAYFMRRIRDAAEAEDLTQEVLMRIAELHSGEIRHPNGYVFTVAANLLKDRYRRERVRDAWRSEAGFREPTADYVDPMQTLEARESLGAVARAVSELSQRSREILLLFRLERMRKRDIADSYGISISAVDKHLIRATAYITKKLEEAE